MERAGGRGVDTLSVYLMEYTEYFLNKTINRLLKSKAVKIVCKAYLKESEIDVEIPGENEMEANKAL